MAWMRTDDLDGTPAEKTTFGLFGKAYVLDAGEATRARMSAALRPFVAVATVYDEMPEAPNVINPPTADPPKVISTEGTRTLVKSDDEPPATPTTRVKPPRKPRRRRTTSPASASSPATPVEHRTIRTWANGHGYQVGPKGRIPAAVIEAFEAAHPA